VLSTSRIPVVYKKPEAHGRVTGLYRQEDLLVNRVEPPEIEVTTFGRRTRKNPSR